MNRRPWVPLPIALAALAVAAAPATAGPVALPGRVLHPGHSGQVEVVTPAAARSCSIAVPGQTSHRVRLGGHSRLVRWRVGRTARGTWRVRLSCRVPKSSGKGATHGTVLERTTAKLTVRRAGHREGRLFAAGTRVASHPGLIRDLAAPAATTRAVAATPRAAVDTSGFAGCPNSTWVKSTHVVGDGSATYVQMEPTTAARRVARFTPGAYDHMWADLLRCAKFGGFTSATDQGTMYAQMVCHAVYGVASVAGGNTWDYEAWRNVVSWETALSIPGRCGQGWGNRPGLGAFLAGKIVNSYPDDNPSQREAWLIDDSGTLQRHHIPDLQIYSCLTSAGRAPARTYPDGFLDVYVPIDGPRSATCGPPVSNPDPGTGGGGGAATDPGAGGAVTDPGAGGGGGNPTPPATHAETVGGNANTWTNYTNAGGTQGTTIPSNQTVQISCRLTGFRVADGNTWWYRIASSPWNNAFYVSADAFYNNGQTSGSLHGTPFVDESVPGC